MSNITSSLKTTLTGYFSYRGQGGHFSFLLHRLSGLGILLFLIIHIVDTASVYFAPELYEDVLVLYRSTPFMLGEIGLVFAVIFHGVNGLRVAYYDLRKPKGWNITAQRQSVRLTFIISIVLWLPAAFWMTYQMLHHNFGLF